jgi:nitrile hydratase accessory protein
MSPAGSSNVPIDLPVDLPVELDVEGVASPPRSNGELAFAEPWESRAFGVTIALHQDGLFTWDEFKDRLIAAIARWEDAHPDGEGYRYYSCWLDALQTLLDDRQILPEDDVERRAAELAERPPGHDHGPGHDHLDGVDGPD